MKKLFALLLALCMVLSCTAFAEEAAPALTKPVVVLFTSDVHCGVDQTSVTPAWPLCVTTLPRTTMPCWWTTATPSRASLWAP